MNVLFVLNISFDGNETSIHLLKDVIKTALDKGHNCHVILKKTNLNVDSKLEELKDKTNLLKLNYVNDFKKPKGNFIKRYFNEYKYALKCKKIYKKNKYDVVFMQSCNAPWFQLSGLKKLKCKIVFNVQDIFPQNLYFSEQLPISKITYPYFKKKQLKALSKISKIITISDDMKQTLVDLGVDSNKIEVVYNWSYGDSVISLENINKENFYDLKIDKNKLNVVYAGNIGKMQNVEYIAKTAKEHINDESIHYYILGNGANKENVLNIVEGLTNVTVLPMQPSKCAESIYAQADVNVIPLIKGGIKTALPSKTATVLRTKTLVVFCVDKNSKFEETLKDSENVYFANNLETSALYEILLKIKEIKNKNIVKTNPNVLTLFSNKNAEKYVEILEEIK